MKRFSVFVSFNKPFYSRFYAKKFPRKEEDFHVSLYWSIQDEYYLKSWLSNRRNLIWSSQLGIFRRILPKTSLFQYRWHLRSLSLSKKVIMESLLEEAFQDQPQNSKSSHSIAMFFFKLKEETTQMFEKKK